ncbi:DUF4372 domain-containing protein [Brumimicrobium oceani]|uniref:DUF4372 domain-containing protein n=1 Tax=Brumimicrobium oceani TaxID=2100725 RepID=A0A2U2XFV4_9FLAO|nr:DUF4372 domain-containing protein [Brumimicrobium oceani]PWH86643.1 hypothetical protein DIT68_05265 [Brumimicrobium oceani]
MSKISKKSGIPVFGQLLSLIPRQDFNISVKNHQSDRYIKRFTSWDHLVTMLFGVIHKVGGLRELCSGLAAHNQSLKHLGVKSLPTKAPLVIETRAVHQKSLKSCFLASIKLISGFYRTAVYLKMKNGSLVFF